MDYKARRGGPRLYHPVGKSLNLLLNASVRYGSTFLTLDGQHRTAEPSL